MAIKLCDATVKRRDELSRALRGSCERSTAAIKEHNALLGGARQFAREVAEAISAEADAGGEHWQQTQQGRDVQAWIEVWRGFAPKDLEEVKAVHEELAELPADAAEG